MVRTTAVDSLFPIEFTDTSLNNNIPSTSILRLNVGIKRRWTEVTASGGLDQFVPLPIEEVAERLGISK